MPICGKKNTLNAEMNWNIETHWDTPQLKKRKENTKRERWGRWRIRKKYSDKEYKRTKPTKRKYVVDEGDFHFVMCSYYHFFCCGLVVPLPSHIRLRSVFPFILCAHSFSPFFPLCSCTIFHELTPMHITIFITLKKKMKKKTVRGWRAKYDDDNTERGKEIFHTTLFNNKCSHIFHL